MEPDVCQLIAASVGVSHELLLWLSKVHGFRVATYVRRPRTSDRTIVVRSTISRMLAPPACPSVLHRHHYQDWRNSLRPVIPKSIPKYFTTAYQTTIVAVS